jgi:hypothetical protein
MLLTLAATVPSNQTIEVSFRLNTGRTPWTLRPQSACTLRVSVGGSEAAPLVAMPRDMVEEGACEMSTLYLNSIHLVLDSVELPLTCIQWNREQGRLTMLIHSTIPPSTPIRFAIFFVNSGHTQQAPRITIRMGDRAAQVLGALAHGDARALRTRMWDVVRIGQSTSDPGELNTLFITLAPAFSLFAPTTITISGLVGTEMVQDVRNVVDCLPSPCLFFLSSTETWDRARGSLSFIVLDGSELTSGEETVVVLATRNSRQTQPPSNPFVEAETSYLDLPVLSRRRTKHCPQGQPSTQDPLAPAAPVSAACELSGEELMEAAIGTKAPLLVRVWERTEVRGNTRRTTRTSACLPSLPLT